MRVAPLLALLGAACAPIAAGPAGTSSAARCDADRAQSLVGQPASNNSGEAKRLSRAATIRQYVTGSPVTMDYRADRLNIETDARGMIVKLSCG
ncbi:I78 family peptidase inhibitor [Sphingomonas sp.]|jgi:hypothetical protein|uniref:I78 family peptidase inhibitor n=1 Tax=Sphingomonas sp. TaxID=28214 RepID=UPI0035C7B222